MIVCLVKLLFFFISLSPGCQLPSWFGAGCRGESLSTCCHDNHTRFICKLIICLENWPSPLFRTPEESSRHGNLASHNCFLASLHSRMSCSALDGSSCPFMKWALLVVIVTSTIESKQTTAPLSVKCQQTAISKTLP